MVKFTDVLGKKILFFDGAMGTLLIEKGMKQGEFSEKFGAENPGIVYSIHTAYLEAGCDIIKANTFGANIFKYPDNLEYILRTNLNSARKATYDTGRGYVALDVGPSGKLLEPFGELSFDGAYENYKQIVTLGHKYADLILIETMSDTMEIKAAVLAAKECSDLPIVVTMTFDESGRLMMGADIETAVAMLEGLGVSAIGFNCGLGPNQVKELLPRMTACSSLPIVVNPNAGLPVVINGKTQYNFSPAAFSEAISQCVKLGAHVVGGCCGTTPAHIEHTVKECKLLPVEKITKKNITVVTSGHKAVYIGNEPIIVGERINPTGKPTLKKALVENNIDYIIEEATTQEDAGAHILDVNVGLADIDEPSVMENVVKTLQNVVKTPLQIDTSNFEAMERGMRIYNGKPLVNSVCGKKSVMEKVFPLIKKYGGVVVALTLDENGIPDNAIDRIKIAKRIITTAKKYGIEKKDIIVDTLTMTLSGGFSADATLDSLSFIKTKLEVNTMLGVSNISFGLPMRDNINSAFLVCALNSGLSAAILNPKSFAMMSAYHSFCALKGFDKNALGYIDFATGTGSESKETNVSKAERTLKDAIKKGLTDEAHKLTCEMLKNFDALEIINTHLIPALDEIGADYNDHKAFLPQLLLSADAAKTSFDAIKEYYSNSPDSRKTESEKTIVMATVEGDVHDIGKNIVKVLLENYGYNVVDLGKDVKCEDVLDSVKKLNPKLLGLSALMTTTLGSMKKTVELVKNHAPDCKIMVGGAVLTQEYAEQIGADFYAPDAVAATKIAEKVFG